MIIMDAVRARNLSCYGYDKPTTPNIDRIAHDGVIFTSAFATTTATDPSLTSILTGKYPASHGIINHGERVTHQEILEFNTSGTLLLPEILKREGTPHLRSIGSVDGTEEDMIIIVD